MKKKQDIIIDTEEVKKRRKCQVHIHVNIHENLDEVINRMKIDGFTFK